MSDNTLDDINQANENADNMAQNDTADETVTSDTTANDETDEIEELVHDLAQGTDKIKAELDEAKDKYLRLVAEFDNFRRRNSKERLELTQTAGKDIIQSLLVVLDDMDRASKQMESEADAEKIKEGISLVFNKLRNILQQRGLKKMDSANIHFDADLHEAITDIPAPTEDMVGKVIDTIEPGYYLNDKLIRHAKVVVGK